MKFLLSLSLVFAFAFRVQAAPAPLTERQNAFIERAQSLGNHPQWLRLLHFHKKQSTIDTKGFFLAPDGKTNPQSELIADLTAFFKGEHLCDFPARRTFLTKELGIGANEMKTPECADYSALKKAVNADNFTLIYTTAFMGNPASFFGHTLMRLDSRENPALLAHALNYGAVTGKDSGFFYAVKGVFGGYPGIFSLYPYYDTVNLYNNMENRDIWEYRLNLTDEQASFLIDHIWELGRQSADYYFFSENCSYMILETLNVVFPEQDWTQNLPPFTIPADTVRLLMKQKGVIKKAVYRPSRQTKIKAAYASLSKPERKALLKLKDDPAADLTELSAPRRAAVYETAYEYLQYRYIEGKVPLSTLREQSVALLKARNALPVDNLVPKPETPAVRPDEAHDSSAFSVSFGRNLGKNFTELELKPALHTVLDNSAGYLPFSGIDYFKAALRVDADGKPSLHRFEFLNLESYAPHDALFHPKAFRLSAGQNRFFYAPKNKELSVFDASADLGASTLLTEHINVFALGSVTFKAGDKTVGGLGARFGVLADFGTLRAKADIAPMAYTRSDANTVSYRAALSVSIGKNLDWVSEFAFDDGRGANRREFKSGLQKHF